MGKTVDGRQDEVLLLTKLHFVVNADGSPHAACLMLIVAVWDVVESCFSVLECFFNRSMVHGMCEQTQNQ